jgi:hypothetical protein
LYVAFDNWVFENASAGRFYIDDKCGSIVSQSEISFLVRRSTDANRSSPSCRIYSQTWLVQGVCDMKTRGKGREKKRKRRVDNLILFERYLQSLLADPWSDDRAWSCDPAGILCV